MNAEFDKFARNVMAEYPDIIKSWETSSDPVNRVLASAIRDVTNPTKLILGESDMFRLNVLVQKKQEMIELIVTNPVTVGLMSEVVESYN